MTTNGGSSEPLLFTWYTKATRLLEMDVEILAYERSKFWSGMPLLTGPEDATTLPWVGVLKVERPRMNSGGKP